MTDGADKKSVEHLLALYCDGELGPEERAEFEKAMANDPKLRAEVELQNRIDASLRDVFSAEISEEKSTIIRSGGTATFFWRAAAVLFFAVSMFVVYRQLMNQFGSKSEPGLPSAYMLAQTTMSEYFEDAMTNGFEPAWVCSGKQFDDTFRKRFGYRILVDKLPANIKLSGLGYAFTRSDQTVTVFIHVDDEPVLLFVEPYWVRGELSPMTEGLYRHERAMERLLIYEVSRFEKPKILDHIAVERCKPKKGK